MQQYLNEDIPEIDLPPAPRPSALQLLGSKLSQFMDDAMRYKRKVFESVNL